MDLGLTGKTALVTGGSRGLGRHTALALAREGCNVAICARGEDGLRQAVDELQALGIKAVGVQADVTTEDGTTHLFSEATDAFEKAVQCNGVDEIFKLRHRTAVEALRKSNHRVVTSPNGTRGLNSDQIRVHNEYLTLAHKASRPFL